MKIFGTKSSILLLYLNLIGDVFNTERIGHLHDIPNVIIPHHNSIFGILITLIRSIMHWYCMNTWSGCKIISC